MRALLAKYQRGACLSPAGGICCAGLRALLANSMPRRAQRGRKPERNPIANGSTALTSYTRARLRSEALLALHYFQIFFMMVLASLSGSW